MNPKVGITLTGLTLALAAMAQQDVTTTNNDHGFDESGRIGGPFTHAPEPEATESAQDHGFGPHGRVGGPYTNGTTNSTHGFGPLGRVGGPYNDTVNGTHGHPTGASASVAYPTPLTTVTVWAKGTEPTETAKGNDEFECEIHELTTSHPAHQAPTAGPTPKDATDIAKQVSELLDPYWSNATETVIFSINPITPTGPPLTPIPGTSPVYTTLIPGTSRNWNGTSIEVHPTGTGAMVTAEGQDGTAEGTHTPMPKHHDYDFVESGSGKVAISAAAIVAALATVGL